MKHIYLTTLVASLAATTTAISFPAAEASKSNQNKKAKKNEQTEPLKKIPSSMSLAELQENIFFYEPSCREATVGIATSFGAQGSGVIASADGMILTAAHVVGELGAESVVWLSNGKSYKAVAVLVNHQTDSAIAKITGTIPEGGFPFRPIRTKADLKLGDWCTVIANGGGIQLNRPAPLRVGRVLTNEKTKKQNVLVSDCTVTSGDSGGPLFDSDGKVCGINSSVGPSSALNNMHVSSATFIQQWGDYISGKKALPTGEEVIKKEKARKAASGEKTLAIPPKLLPAIKQALKQQYPDLLSSALDAMLAKAEYANGQLTINADEELTQTFEKLGLNPAKYGIQPSNKKAPKKDQPKDKVQPKKAEEIKPVEPAKPKENKGLGSVDSQLKQQFGDMSPEAMAYLKDLVAKNNGKVVLSKAAETKLKELGLDLNEFHKRSSIRKKFGQVSEEAMKFILTRFEKNEKGAYELKVSPKDIATLKGMGVNVLNNQGKYDSEEEMLTALFRQDYGKDLPQEAIDLLLRAAQYNKETGELRMNFDASMLKDLKRFGIDIETDGGANLAPFEKNHGDSAASITKYFPQTPAPIHLHQAGKRIGLATAISSDGKILCKSSSLQSDKNISISINGKKISAKLIARDEISDLALLQAQLDSGASLDVVEWGDTPRRGKLLISATEATPKLGVVSVDKRIVPEKMIGVGNGNRAILGVVSDVSKKVKGSYIEKVQADSPAAKGGIQSGDIITAVGGTSISSQKELREQVGKYQGGDVVKFTIKRGDKTLDLMITLVSAEKSDMFSSDATNSAAQDLSALAGELSPRRTTFPEAFSHDALIWHDDCGGPVYTIDGKLLGINIARYSRITSYALTQKSVNEALERMGE